jgi:hypothetical protein
VLHPHWSRAYSTRHGNLLSRLRVLNQTLFYGIKFQYAQTFNSMPFQNPTGIHIKKHFKKLHLISCMLPRDKYIPRQHSSACKHFNTPQASQAIDLPQPLQLHSTLLMFDLARSYQILLPVTLTKINIKKNKKHVMITSYMQMFKPIIMQTYEK